MTVQMHPKQVLVVIAEAAIEKRIVRDAERLGAHGYTAIEARGSGPGGERAADWEADRSVRIEIIADEHVCSAIAEHLLKTYCEHYAVSMYVTDCRVLRPQKF